MVNDIVTSEVTFPALNIPKRPALFFNFIADMVPLLVSDLNPPEPGKLMVAWKPPLPSPLLDESEPMLPLRTSLKSSNGTSSGGRNPDLYFSITSRESYFKTHE